MINPEGTLGGVDERQGDVTHIRAHTTKKLICSVIKKQKTQNTRIPPRHLKVTDNHTHKKQPQIL